MYNGEIVISPKTNYKRFSQKSSMLYLSHDCSLMAATAGHGINIGPHWKIIKNVSQKLEI
jgi:hypothetical protein